MQSVVVNLAFRIFFCTVCFIKYISAKKNWLITTIQFRNFQPYTIIYYYGYLYVFQYTTIFINCFRYRPWWILPVITFSHFLFLPLSISSSSGHCTNKEIVIIILRTDYLDSAIIYSFPCHVSPGGDHENGKWCYCPIDGIELNWISNVLPPNTINTGFLP